MLLRGDGAALLQLRDNKPGLRHAGMWVPPGGHAEPGEAPDVCARREMREETEYDCADLRRLTVLEDRDGYSAHKLTVFWAPFDGVQAIRCHEGQALEFIRRDRAEDYPIPPYFLDIWDLALEAFRQEGK